MRIALNQKALERLPTSGQDEVVEALRELDYKARHSPLEFYFPHPRQEVFHAFTAPVKVFLGGTQSGKTTGCLADDLIQALDRQDLPEHLQPYKKFEPPFLCRVMAPSFPVLETTLYQKLQELLPATTLIGESWGRAFDKNLRVLHFKNGSKFFFATYEQEVSKMGGATLDRVHYDEEPPAEHREEGRFRVMRRKGDEIFGMTPTEGLTWAYDALWQDRGEETEIGVFRRPDQELVTVDMDDNPALTEEAKELALKDLSKAAREMRKRGRFVALHGRIYEDFRPERHIVPELDRLPEFVNVVVGIDPGVGESSCAVVWAFVDAKDRMVVFNEGYFEGMTAGQVAKSIHEANAYYGITPIWYVIDPSARNKEHITGRSVMMEYADHQIVAIAGQNDVAAGINRIQERLQREQGFQITANCPRLIKEFERYRWRKPPRTGEDGRPKPFKKDDHGLDACRYIAMSRPYLPELPDDSTETTLERAMRESIERAAGQSERSDALVGRGI